MAHGRSSNYVIDSSNRPSDPARIKSTRDKESPKERSAIALFSLSVPSMAVLSEFNRADSLLNICSLVRRSKLTATAVFQCQFEKHRYEELYASDECFGCQ